MIYILQTNVTGWEAAIRGMRNPMNSWKKSDSFFKPIKDNCSGCHNYDKCDYIFEPDGKPYREIIGPNDLKLMKSLSEAGSDHRKFMRFINVTCDIIAPLYW